MTMTVFTGGGAPENSALRGFCLTNVLPSMKTDIEEFRLIGRNNAKKTAFTLAEVLITLGIIGIVAAMTLPALIQHYEKMVLKNQFKKSYSVFFNAVKLAQAKNEAPFACYRWVGGDRCALVCVDTDPVFGICLRATCKDGSPTPNDVSGVWDDCFVFEEQLFTKTLKVAKFCQNNALANGCITDEYRGTDKVREEQAPNAGTPQNPNIEFSDTNIKNKFSSWVLVDGTVVMKQGRYKIDGHSIYAIDINGHRKPNKWGHDIFVVSLKGNTTDGIVKFDGVDYVTEKGGVSTAQMIKDMHK